MDVSATTIVISSLLTVSISIFIVRTLLPTTTTTQTPRPQSHPLIGNLIGFLRNRHRFHDWIADMLAHTPSLTLQADTFLLLSRGVCTALPANLDHMLRSNFPNYVKGRRFHSFLSDLLGRGIFNADGPLWSLQRKLASHEFNTRSLRQFISDTVAAEITGRLIPALDDRSGGGDRAFDLQDVLQRFGFDNVCNVAFGFDPESLSSSSSYEKCEFARAFDDAVSICSSRIMSPLPLVWKVKRFLNVGSEKRLKEAIAVIEARTAEIIASKEARIGDGDQDLLSRFMSSGSILEDEEFEDEECRRKFLRDIVASFILAGRDSTSTALTWFFWLVSAHPNVAGSIRRELSELRDFGYDELKKCHYLHAAISESLRLFPPIPVNTRLVVSEDVFPDGTRVGKGWFADYSAYAMGRMERLWGPDCREFKPERWLDSGGVFCPRDQFSFAVFHGGPRMCLGKEMAYVQMKSVVAAVMSEFDIVALDGGGCVENMVNPPYDLSLLLKMKGGFLVKVERRKQV